MKNVSMTINSNAITSLAPPPMPLTLATAFPVPQLSEYSVSFSVRFDNEDEAIAFAKFALNDIECFKKGDR